MIFSLSRYRMLDPNTEGGGGGGGAGGGTPPAGNPPPANNGTPPANGAANFDPAKYVPRADFDRVSTELGGFKKEFSSLRSDYDRRFGPAPDPNSGEIKTEPKLEDYENTQAGIAKYLADFNKFHTVKNWTEQQTASQKKASEQAQKAKRQTSVQSHVKRMGEAMGRYKDFEQVIQNAAIPLPDGQNGQPDILGDVLDSDFSADLHYHLSKNPGDLYALVNAYNQGERIGAKFLGRLEARFAREAEERKRTQRQVRGGSASAEAGDNLDGGGADDDKKYDDLASEAWGLNKKKKE